LPCGSRSTQTEDAVPGLGEGDRQVQGRRRLGDPALLVREADHLGALGRHLRIGRLGSQIAARLDRLARGDAQIVLLGRLRDRLGDRRERARRRGDGFVSGRRLGRLLLVFLGLGHDLDRRHRRLGLEIHLDIEIGRLDRRRMLVAPPALIFGVRSAAEKSHRSRLFARTGAFPSHERHSPGVATIRQCAGS
jgi:hypothetical protein